MPNAPPALRAGAVVAEEDLATLARAVLDRDKMPVTTAATRLGVAISSVSDALNRPGTRMNALRLRILREIGGYEAEGPFYRLRKL